MSKRKLDGEEEGEVAPVFKRAKIVNKCPASFTFGDNLTSAGVLPAFTTMAKELLHGFTLAAGDVEYRLLEIEFYLYHSGAHPDPFSHRHPLQLSTCGAWYFHRSGPSGTYRGGTFKGLDVTFGAAGKAHGGILFRTMQRMEDGKEGKVIEGPCNIVHELLKVTKKGSIPEFVESKGFSLEAFEPGLLYLKPIPAAASTNTGEAEVYSSPRVGLTLKQSEGDREGYVLRPYRFLSAPALRHVKKNRATVLLALHLQGVPAERIASMAATTAAKLKPLTAAFDEARNKGRGRGGSGSDEDGKEEEGESESEGGEGGAGTVTRKRKLLAAWHGKAIKPADLPRFYGAWCGAFAK